MTPTTYRIVPLGRDGQPMRGKMTGTAETREGAREAARQLGSYYGTRCRITEVAR